ncbi:MAG: hypothetical protein JF599_05205 [Verrucomicrobia bacterium]|nr:hypothetical protein [Verrucomicrobiota bacterium]
MEKRVEHRFEVSVGAALKIDTCTGEVRITEGDSQAIEVVVIEQANVADETSLDRLLRGLDLRIDEKEGTVNITARARRWLAWSWQDWSPVSLAYEITVPRVCDLEVRTREGRIIVGKLQGRMALTTESGPIFTAEIDGEVKARSRSGAVAVTACTGLVDVRTSTGSITVGRAYSRAELASDGGYIELQQAHGPVLVRGNGTEAKVGLASPFKNGADIATSGGDVLLAFDNTSACTLDLHASIFGHVQMRGLAVDVSAGGQNRSTLAGTVNGGGPVIKVDASGGNVQVRGQDPIPSLDPSSASRE